MSKASVRKVKKEPYKGLLQIEVYVNTCKDLLGLKDWKVIYKPLEEPAKEAEADIATAHGKVAYLRLNKNFFSFSPEYQRNIICHELLHIHLGPMDECLMSTREVIGLAAYSILDAQLNEASENATQTLSHLLEGILPLPSWK